jgi:hypothetical protein
MTARWPSEGTWLRCALHAHTTESDGDLPPQALVAHYERAGYDVLAITDHWKITTALSTERLLVLPGVELNCILPGARDGHVLGFGVAAEPAELQELAARYAGLEETAAWIAAHADGEHGGVAYLAHPYWTGIEGGALDLPPGVAGIEVYNAGCELEVGRGLSTVHWDDLLERGRLCPAIACDDSHHPGFDSDLAWTWVRVAERRPAAVLSALRQGRCYGSAGPSLDEVVVDGDIVEVRCSPCRAVTLVSGKSIGAAVNAGRLGYRHAGEILETSDAGLVVRARLEVPPAARHVRVEVTDADGRKAWASPFAV